MADFFAYEMLPIVWNMSLTASVVTGFVLLARLALRRAPKVYSYVLWAVVLFRLLCPVSVSSAVSLLNVVDAPVTERTPVTSVVEYVPPLAVPAERPVVQIPVPGAVEAAEPAPVAPAADPAAVAAWVWLLGVAALAGYSIVSLLALRRRLTGAVRLEGNVWLADHIDSPFVLGLLRPKIYLPSALPEGERGYILLHERHHIRRGDHLIKALFFAALCLHWFNPLVWLAFVLMGRDMEMSCDEAVVKKLGADVRADYSASLLSLATGRRMVAGAPLAFGEGDTKGRIKNLLRWKAPRRWVMVLAALVSLAVVCACAANPEKEEEPPAPEPAIDEELLEEMVSSTFYFRDMEHYAQIWVNTALEENKVTYYTADETGEVSPEPFEDTVEDARVVFLDKGGELAGLDPNGTLEVWEMGFEVKPTNAAGSEIVLAGGSYLTDDGYYHNNIRHLVIVLRREDGRYQILEDRTGPEHIDFYAHHASAGEALADWYIQNRKLDLPLYVENWIDRVTVPEPGSLGDFPVHRFDGDGWYIYVPMMAWKNTGDAKWISEYDTGSVLEITRTEKTAESLQNQGFTSTDGVHWTHPASNMCVDLYAMPNGDTIWVTTDYDSSRITEYPYIAMEPQVLRLMAESFTLDERMQGITLPTPEPIAVKEETVSVPEGPPTAGEYYDALMALHGRMGLETAVDPFATVAYNVLWETWNEQTASLYVYAYFASFDCQEGRHLPLAGYAVPASLTFTWNDGWHLTDSWAAPDGEDVGSLGIHLPNQVFQQVTAPQDSAALAELNARCTEDAIRYYAAKNGTVPAKRFTAADVEFTDQPLDMGETDPMTYDERLAWVQAEPDDIRDRGPLGQYAAQDGCLAYLWTWYGTPHPGSDVFTLRFPDGATAYLPRAQEGYFSSAEVRGMAFREGKFVYELTFARESLTNEGQTLMHLAGTYHYEVDLAARTVSLTLLETPTL